MKRENENISNEEAANRYLNEHWKMGDNEFNMAIYDAYVAACEWKDEQHEKGKEEDINNYMDQIHGHYVSTSTL